MTGTYTGPQCPYCSIPLGYSELRTGAMQCSRCSRSFEATVLSPVEHRFDNAAILTATPDGVANACANHARNAAVTNCQRCGLFICTLCDMNVGEGSFCPSCFDRVRAEGSLKTAVMRYRDYASMARSAVIIGLFGSMAFLGVAFGGVGIYYALRGIRQRRDEGASPTGMVFTLILAVLETLSTFALIAWIVMAGR